MWIRDVKYWLLNRSFHNVVGKKTDYSTILGHAVGTWSVHKTGTHSNVKSLGRFSRSSQKLSKCSQELEGSSLSKKKEPHSTTQVTQNCWIPESKIQNGENRKWIQSILLSLCLCSE